MKLGFYIDFDNLIGGFKAHLELRNKKALSDFQKVLIPLILKNFLQSLKIPPNVEEYYEILFKKVFSEYHNIPLKGLLKPEPFVFLYNIGITPINPFVVSSGTKNKNASDISLTLEVANDLIVKSIPIDGIILFSGDIDFYPLISWVREHTGKEVFLISFSDRLNKAYREIFKHLIDLDHIIPAEIYLIEALVKTFEETMKNLNNNDINIIFQNKNNIKTWIQKLFQYFERKYLNIIAMEAIEQAEFKILASLDSISVSVYNPCEEFYKYLILGLKNWLKEHEKASTGLIIRSWFPRWRIPISEEEANNCLRQILEKKKYEKEGFIFEGTLNKGIPIGVFVKKT